MRKRYYVAFCDDVLVSVCRERNRVMEGCSIAGCCVGHGAFSLKTGDLKIVPLGTCITTAPPEILTSVSDEGNAFSMMLPAVSVSMIGDRAVSGGSRPFRSRHSIGEREE